MASDIVFEQGKTRVIDVLDVATSPQIGPAVKIDPSGTGSIELPQNGSIRGGSVTVRDSGSVEAQNRSGTTVGAVRAYDDGCEVELTSGNSDAGIELSTTGSNGVMTMTNSAGAADMIEVGTTNDTATISLGSALGPKTVSIQGDTTSNYRTGGGGIVLRHKRTGNTTATAVTKQSGGGLVTAHDDSGVSTCQLHGDDAALVLSGTQELGPSDRRAQRYGGGEVVLQQGDPGADISRTDIQVHAKGERDSDYGLDGQRSHRPRIVLDGPEATAELGRKQQDPNAEAVPGSVSLRGTNGSELLRANAADPDEKRQTGNERAEIEFNVTDRNGNEFTKGGGAIRAHPDGLMFYDADGDRALFITFNGEIHTKKGAIKQGAL